ncbi:MAG TPA: beta-N-acetylglucosaminidase domain-containing protein [Nakamurella sp.]|nr:beta-N-acetylglucosaminidase domain-containing protein [Nakamurella sp.]
MLAAGPAAAASTAPDMVPAAPDSAAGAATAAGPSTDATTLPGVSAIYPVPQSVTAGTPVHLRGRVSLVVGPDADASALSDLRDILTGQGSQVRTYAPSDPLPEGGAFLYLGTETGNPSIAPALAEIGVDAAEALSHSEGYVLATGRHLGRQVAVLAGHDGAGTFYAVQTLRQVVAGGNLQPVVVKDWPAFPIRGVIEGFYGTPWSHAARLSQLDFYGAHKMNTYVYSPKDDPYLRAQWRDPYPADKLAQIAELVDRAVANHVEFTYALSPGLSVCYSSATDEQALIDKFQTLWDIGVRTFAVPLDDISYTDWHCDADPAMFGTGGGAAGRAQAYLLNEVQRDFIDTHPGASRLEMVPTEYSNTADSAYKTALRENLDRDIVVEWTGVGVIAPTITTAQAAAAHDVFGHDILVWDNYPVNDYVTNRLLLAPYVGRDPGLADDLFGITANPMIQPEASKIALFTVADYTWNPPAYDPHSSWEAGLTELSGGDPQARAALAAFADLNYTSRLDDTQAPVLAGKLADFWPAWEQGADGAAQTLDDYLAVIAGIPDTLAQRMHDDAFVADTQPWLDSAGTWGEAARAALQMLVDQRAGDGAAALADRVRAESLAAQARSFQYHGLNGAVTVTVGDGVIDAFVAAALAENDRWLGVAGRHVTATTSMPTYQSYDPANMVDGNPDTWYWSSRSPSSGDYVGVDLGTVQPISTVTILAGDAASPNDYLHVATLEYSADGSHWSTIETYVNTAHIQASVPPGTQARYVRLRATASDGYWVKVHEFTVTGPENARLTVTGTPEPAADSSLAAAADGNVDTSYVAGSAPAEGDALLVALPDERPLDRVVVVGSGHAQVQVQVDGSWQTLGPLDSSGYTDLDAAGASTDRIRLAWTAGSPAPTIAEVIPWYDDVPSADLTVAPEGIDVQVGSDATVTATLTATRARDVTGTLTAEVPAGVSASPASSTVTLWRGSQPSLEITLTAAATGTFQVPISFTPDGEAPITETVQLRVHPQVSDTNVALAGNGGIATASSVEQNLARFTPDHANDGDQSTRWSSGYDDAAWLQIEFAGPQHLGKIVILWEAAHANAYRIETSADGTTWTDAADITGSLGGTETIWIDQTGVRFLRMQGVQRATPYGYSIYELQAYPVV